VSIKNLTLITTTSSLTLEDIECPKSSFTIKLKWRGHVYQKPYPDYYDQLLYPRGYKMPKFSKFSGEHGKITLEHGDTEHMLSHLTAIKQKQNEHVTDYIN
jgi:hypothetical protein